MESNEKKKRGGARPGAGRPRTDSQYFNFRVGGEVARAICEQENRSAFIAGCIREHIEAERAAAEPDFTRVGEAWSATQVEPVQMPRFDVKVVAGFPIPLDNDERAKKIDVLQMLCPHPEATYLIHVTGDSMVESNIHSGDILVIDKSRRNPSEHEVAMCELNGEYTVKFVRRHNGRVWLVPANEAYPEIEVEEGDQLTVWGVVTYVIHKPLGV